VFNTAVRAINELVKEAKDACLGSSAWVPFLHDVMPDMPEHLHDALATLTTSARTWMLYPEADLRFCPSDADVQAITESLERTTAETEVLSTLCLEHREATLQANLLAQMR